MWLIAFCEQLLNWSILCRELMFGKLTPVKAPEPDINEGQNS